MKITTLLKRSAPKVKRSSSVAPLKAEGRSSSPHQGGTLLKRSAPQAQRSSPSDSYGSNMFLETILDLLRSGRSVRFRAPGRSMHPTIKDGETITVEPVKPSGIKRGDIVLYRLDKGVIAHRVVRIEKNDGAPLFILRGDALGAQDEAAAVQQVLGKVVSVQRGGRSIDLYNRRAKMVRIAYVCVSRLRRWMMPT